MASDLVPEEQFGPYLVYERIGVGGMATVHRALERQPDGVDRMVALKRPLAHLAEDASFIKAFVREARLASLLDHVNIVEIYELGRVGTEYFITMEYIDGRDLRQVLRHARRVAGPPPINVAVGLLVQLTEALEYAHSKVDDEGRPLGIVHRDVSPSNLLLTTSGHLKVIDFGIAKAESSHLQTATGRVKGKLAYMAPEAVSSGKELDSRCDLWAAGVILHEVLCARPLFASKNEYDTLARVQKGDIAPPSKYNPEVPRELDAVVAKALARDPQRRYQYARDMRDDLLAVKKQLGLQTGYRDIATWVTWAFSLDRSEPSAPVISVATPTRPVRNPEEDEAAEVVWGSSGAEGVSGPLVLDDVPDVSRKHAAPPLAVALRAPTNEDDIPTPEPTHGVRPPTEPGFPELPKPSRTTSPGLAVRGASTPVDHLPSPAALLGRNMPSVVIGMPEESSEPRRRTGRHTAVRPATAPDDHHEVGDTALATGAAAAAIIGNAANTGAQSFAETLRGDLNMADLSLGGDTGLSGETDTALADGAITGDTVLAGKNAADTDPVMIPPPSPGGTMPGITSGKRQPAIAPISIATPPPMAAPVVAPPVVRFSKRQDAVGITDDIATELSREKRASSPPPSEPPREKRVSAQPPSGTTTSRERRASIPPPAAGTSLVQARSSLPWVWIAVALAIIGAAAAAALLAL